MLGASIVKSEKIRNPYAPKTTLTTEIIEDARPGIDLKGNPRDKAYKIWDSRGLFLLVAPSGGKWWRFKYRYGGRDKRLCAYPFVSLAEARTNRDACRDLVARAVNGFN